MSVTGDDYAGAWQGVTGRCHRLVYDDQGKPAHCPRPVVAKGWRKEEYTGRWRPVEACERHRGEIDRPAR